MKNQTEVLNLTLKIGAYILGALLITLWIGFVYLMIHPNGIDMQPVY